MAKRGLRAQLRVLTAMVSQTFHLPVTGRMILETLLKAKRALTVKELVSRIRRSERSVRGSLEQLVSKGVLIRRVSITGKKRLAYLYTLGPLERIVKVLRGEILNRLARLEHLEGTLQEQGH